MIATPGFLIDTSGTDGSFHVLAIKSVLAKLSLASEQRLETKTHSVKVKKSLSKSFQSSANRLGKKLPRRLAKKYAFQRYALAADYGIVSQTNPAKIVVREGLPPGIMVLASSNPCHQDII
ncbi:hypothetical protein DL771_008504 [Monosporascus sp. 5C6A]|nr:hypothetical protein DL771_008504 [Monosporascus sp. 5C6A]